MSSHYTNAIKFQEHQVERFKKLVSTKAEAIQSLKSSHLALAALNAIRDMGLESMILNTIEFKKDPCNMCHRKLICRYSSINRKHFIDEVSNEIYKNPS